MQTLHNIALNAVMPDVHITLVAGGDWTAEIGRGVPQRGKVAGMGPTWHSLQSHCVAERILSAISNAILIVGAVDILRLMHQAASQLARLLASHPLKNFGRLLRCQPFLVVTCRIELEALIGPVLGGDNCPS